MCNGGIRPASHQQKGKKEKDNFMFPDGSIHPVCCSLFSSSSFLCTLLNRQSRARAREEESNCNEQSSLFRIEMHKRKDV